jgi:Flp pilus assembly protein TadD
MTRTHTPRKQATPIQATSIALTCLAIAATLPSAQAQNPPDLLQQAHTLAEAASFSQAEALTRTYLRTHDNSADAHYLLAFCLLREDKPVASLAEYTRAAALRKPNPDELRNVALDYVLANDYVDADKWMTQVVSWSPQDGESWYDLGRIKYTENRFTESVTCFQHALALMPKQVKAENNLGLSYEGLDRIPDALAAYRQAIAWQAGAPHPSAQPFINLGTLLLDQNQAAPALQALQQAEALSPDDAKLCMTLGKAYDRTGNLPQAQAQLEHAVALSPQTAAYHFLLGQTYRKSGATEKAKAQFAEAAALDGSHSSK